MLPWLGAPSNELDLSLPSTRDSVTEARHVVMPLADLAGVDTEQVALAVSEAVGNAVRHAFPGDAAGTIVVRARVRGGELIVIVTDDGIGMTPDLEDPGLGVGTSLISRLAREATFESSAAGTTVTMRFSSAGGDR
jgi:two-component sensor histidine kinase